MKDTKIISAFPGTGKTTLYKNDKYRDIKIMDSDISKFDKKYFPKNYIEYIKNCIGI